MAISPPGDIIMDVVKAADPTAVQTARTRLATMAGRAGESLGFSVAGTPAAKGGDASAETPEAFAKFEAMVLQTFLQNMLPKETSSVYGEGLAGEMWQSLLAEKLGDAMAERGGIGIADRILRSYYMEGDEKVPLQGVSNDPDKAERDSQEMLSVALVQELQRKVTQSLQEDRAAASQVTSR
ncbi:rod-binding protein [Mesorhizobium sp. CAU 1741]|uniref:rod-binding protein n=1 Tax=Mesorhizobium sp. CAU 1741 TaxID=3140366 RepID=UPI00325A5476